MVGGVDRRIICAPANVPILDFYETSFDEVFVSLNPFIKINSTSKLKYSTWFDFLEPTKKEILENCDRLLWKDFQSLSQIASKSDLDIALRTSIGGLVEKFQKKELVDSMIKVFEEKNIILPEDGKISIFSDDDILKALRKLGHEKICIGCKFGSTEKEVLIDKILNDEVEIGDSNLFTIDRKVLITFHWDSHQTYICSNKETVDFIRKNANLEGFYCDEKTEIYWSLKNGILK